MKIVLLFLIFCVSEEVKCAKILAVMPTPFYSHQATFRPLWRELARKGHKITLLTTNPMEYNENITQIDYGKVYKLFEKHRMMQLLREGNGIFSLIPVFFEMLDDVFTFYFTHSEFVKLMENDPKFDLLFVELMMPIFPVLGSKFGCPMIGLNTMDAFSITHASVGNAAHPAMFPYVDLAFDRELSFTQRLISTAFLVMVIFIGPALLSPLGNPYVKKYIGEDLPDVVYAQTNVSMIFYNANPIFFPTRPVTAISINLEGGLHLEAPKKLPKDLQEYLDESKDGCIYFSFGTTVNSNYLTPEIVEIFRKTFGELAPLRVLWKYENSTLENKPKNLEIRKWFPQQDILRHPNVKVFITQGGLQSMEEAIDSAVPMLGMPFYGDQINNVKKMSLKQFGIALDVKTMDGEALKNSILELISNPLYKKNIEKLSRISKDQPMRGLEKAVWWTEYVLRHGGTEHLRSPSADIPLYQYFFLDIIAFLCVVLIFISLVFYYVLKMIRLLFRKIFTRRNKEKTN